MRAESPARFEIESGPGALPALPHAAWAIPRIRFKRGLVGLKVTGDRGAAGLGALVYAINPFALLQTAEIQSEPSTLPLSQQGCSCSPFPST
jgi:hypothetical protein